MPYTVRAPIYRVDPDMPGIGVKFKPGDVLPDWAVATVTEPDLLVEITE